MCGAVFDLQKFGFHNKLYDFIQVPCPRQGSRSIENLDLNIELLCCAASEMPQ